MRPARTRQPASVCGAISCCSASRRNATLPETAQIARPAEAGVSVIATSQLTDFVDVGTRHAACGGGEAGPTPEFRRATEFTPRTFEHSGRGGAARFLLGFKRVMGLTHDSCPSSHGEPNATAAVAPSRRSRNVRRPRRATRRAFSGAQGKVGRRHLRPVWSLSSGQPAEWKVPACWGPRGAEAAATSDAVEPSRFDRARIRKPAGVGAPVAGVVFAAIGSVDRVGFTGDNRSCVRTDPPQCSWAPLPGSYSAS